MKVKAILYSSNTGSTAQYARILSEKTGLPAYALAEAEDKVKANTPVLFMSWLMAGTLKDYKLAAKKFNIAAACSVGLNATPEQEAATRKSAGIAENVPLFALRGGYYPDRLRGMYKWMMKLVTKVLIRKISSMENKGEEEEAMLYTLEHGGSFVHEENLQRVEWWLQA